MAVGTAGDDFAVVRYTTSGALDGSFGGGTGRVTTDIASGSLDGASDVAIQTDGKIVVVGGRTVTGLGSRMVVVRYTTAGLLDPTFNGTGIFVTNVGGLRSEALGVAIQPDGRIVVAGTAFGGPETSVAVIGLLTGGTLDGSFGTNGKVNETLGAGDDVGADVAAVGNKIIVGGWGINGYLLARFLGDGTLDASFSDHGSEYTALAGDARGLAVQPSDGKVVLVGEAPSELGDEDFTIVRYDQ